VLLFIVLNIPISLLVVLLSMLLVLILIFSSYFSANFKDVSENRYVWNIALKFCLWFIKTYLMEVCLYLVVYDFVCSSLLSCNLFLFLSFIHSLCSPYMIWFIPFHPRFKQLYLIR
jgi:hypothetical protein